MEANRLILMVGAPGAGKSTWCANFMTDHAHEGWRVINGDAVRLDYCREMGIDYRQAHLPPHLGEVSRRFYDRLRDAVQAGVPLLIDVMNSSREERRALLGVIEAMREEAGKPAPHYPERMAMTLLITPEEAIARKAQAGAMRQARGEPAMDVPEPLIRQFVDTVHANLPRVGGVEGFTDCQYVCSPGFAAGYPHLAASIDRMSDERPTGKLLNF